MTYGAIVEQIKTEGRIKGDDDFTPTVIGLLNELFQEATESQRPFELREEATLALTTGNGTVALPANFFVHHQVFFNDADTSRRYPLTDQDKAIPPSPRGLFGHPKSYEIMSGNIGLKPATGIVTGDTLLLVYYKIPPIVTDANLSTTNPIPRLEPFLIRAAIRRIRLLHSDDVQVAQILTGDITSAASGYAKDEPAKK